MLKDYVFTFSTGDAIDTLSLVGKTISAETLKAGEDFFVMLYSDENDTITLDSLPFSVMPNYVTKTNKEGNFMLTGLADKQYLLFALKDANSNMIYDVPNEEIGFCGELVRPQYIPRNQVITDSSAILPKIDTMIYELKTFIQEDSIQKIFKKNSLKTDCCVSFSVIPLTM